MTPQKKKKKNAKFLKATCRLRQTYRLITDPWSSQWRGFVNKEFYENSKRKWAEKILKLKMKERVRTGGRNFPETRIFFFVNFARFLNGGLLYSQ